MTCSRCFLLFVISVLLAGAPAYAATYYFDVNAGTAGSGVTNGGSYTWSGAYWSTSAAGGSTSNRTWTSAPGHDVHFVAASDAAGRAYTVAPSSVATTYTQNLTVNSGNMVLANAGSADLRLGSNATWTVNATASLQVTGGAGTGGALNMNGFSLTAAVSGSMEVAGLGNSPGSLTKSGSGNLTISGNTTYSGDTTVSSGILTCAKPSLPDNADVTLAKGAVLKLSHGVVDRVRRLFIDGLESASGKWGAPGSVAGGTADFESPAISGTGVLLVLQGAEPTPVGVDPAGTAFAGTLGAEFNTNGDSGGWVASQVTGGTVSGGVLTGTSSGNATTISLTGIAAGPNLDLGFNDYLEVRMQVPAGYAGDIRFSYGTGKTPGFSADRTFVIPAGTVATDGAFHTYRIDLSLERLWDGTLTDLRINPVNSAGLAFAIDYIRVGDLPGDAYATWYGDFPAAGDHEVVSKHFRFRWTDYLSNDPAVATNMNAAWAMECLRNAEECWSLYVKALGYKEPNLVGGVKYKIDFKCEDGGNWATVSPAGHPYLNIGPGGLASGTTVISHELMHVFQFAQGGSMPGDWYESHANYGRERRYEFFLPGQSELTDIAVRDGHLALHAGRSYYLSWPFYLYLDENPDRLPGLGEGTVVKLWQQCANNEYPHNALSRIAPAAPVKDIIGGFARHMVTLDFKFQSALRSASCDGGLPGDVFGTELVQTAEDAAWWRVPMEKAPMQGGYAMHPLVVSGTGSGRVVTANLRPLHDPSRGTDFRASLVVQSDEGTIRYSTMWSTGNNSVTLAANENKVWLVVAATPDMTYLELNEAPTDWPYRTAAGKQRFHYEVQLTGATPRETGASGTAGLVQHANGGGWKAATATVDPTAYVGPNARVLDDAQVRDNARIEDFATVSGSGIVRGNAVVSGHARVTGTVEDSARVRDYALAAAVVGGSARLLQHGEMTGGVLGGSATVRGTAWNTGGNVTGWAIHDGAYYYWGDAASTFAAGHEPFVGLSDSWRYAIPERAIAAFPCDADHGDYLLDTISGSAAFCRGGTWVASDGGRTGVISLSGSNQWLTFDRSLVDYGALTVDFWVKPQAGGPANQALFWIGSLAARRLVLTPDDGSGHARVTVSDGVTEQSIVGSSPIPAGSWSNVAVVLQGTLGRLLVNGVEIASGAIPFLPENLASGNTNTTPLRVFIGRSEGSVQPMFQGLVDDVKFISRALLGTLTWDGTNNNWNSAHWSSGNQLFYAGSSAVINAGTVTLTGSESAYAVTLNGGTIASAGGGTLTLDASLTTGGTQTSTVSGKILLGNGAGHIFSVAPTGDPGGTDLLVSGSLADISAGSWGQLVKAGTGRMVISGANTLSGGTWIQSGTLQVNSGGALGGSTAPVTLGNGTVANLILGTDVTAGAFSVESNTADTTTPSNICLLSIAGGKTLAVARFNAGIPGTTKTALGTGSPAGSGGTLSVAGDITIGCDSTVSSQATAVDFSGLAALNMNAPAGGFVMGNGLNSSSYVTLAGKSNLLNAALISVGDSGGFNYNSAHSILSLGAGNNTLQADAVVLGAAKGAGEIKFATSNGSVTIAGTGGGSKKADITLGNASIFSYVTGTNLSQLALAGHQATVHAGTVIVAQRNGASSGGPIAKITFDTGNFTADTLILASDIAGGSTSSTGLNGSFILGSSPASTGTLLVTTSFHIASNTNPAVNDTVTGTFTINGGVADLRCPIRDASTRGTSNTTVTVNGGTLDMNGFPIGGNNTGGNLTIDNLNFQSGTLRNIGQINNGAALVKSTAGTLSLAGTNTYTGGTQLSAGQLNLNSATALGSGPLAIGSNATLGNTSGGPVAISTSNPQSWNGNFTFAGQDMLNLGSGAVTLTTNVQVTVNSSILAAGGSISGSYSLTKAGAGTLALDAGCGYSGGTRVNGGTLSAGTSGTLGSGNLTVAAGAACLLQNPLGAIADTASVFLSGNATLNVAAGVTEMISQLFIDGALVKNGTWNAARDPVHFAGSGSVVVTNGVPLTPVETWRQQYFARIDNTGSAADDADPDSDGFTNLAERAFGANPLGHDAGRFPAVDSSAPGFSLTFTVSRSASDLQIVIERSTTLAAGSWTAAAGTTAVTDDSNPDYQRLRFTPGASTDPRAFFRARILPETP